MLPPHKWEISVSAGSNYSSLADSFCGNDISLCYENDYLGIQFFAHSYHIDEIDDPIHVAQRLYSLELLLNGALRATSWKRINTIPIQFTGFALCEVGCRYSIYAEDIEENPFSQNPELDKDHSVYDNPRKNYSSYLFNLAKIDPNLRGILFLLGLISTNSTIEKILTWGTLYKIFDSVKYHSKKIGIPIDKLVDVSKLESFKAACNNMSILGLYARHGVTANPPPTKVIIDISEAINLISTMAANFCKRYVQIKYL